MEKYDTHRMVLGYLSGTESCSQLLARLEETKRRALYYRHDDDYTWSRLIEDIEVMEDRIRSLSGECVKYGKIDLDSVLMVPEGNNRVGRRKRPTKER